MSVEPQRALSDDGEVTNTNQPSSEPAGHHESTMASSVAWARGRQSIEAEMVSQGSVSTAHR